MIRRTTVDLDYDLLERAQRALGCPTARATIHEALRRAVDAAGTSGRAALRDSYLDHLGGWADLKVLESDAAWR